MKEERHLSDSTIQTKLTKLRILKSSGKTIKDLKQNAAENRTTHFLTIFSRIYYDYCDYLKRTSEIDFNDMINEAIQRIRSGEFHSPYAYILVDEFHDISQSRYRLLKAVLDQNDAKLFCVGDDWQSIYRFTGSDLSIMLDFQEHFGDCEQTLLTTTFRFNGKLCDFSTHFILQNPNQIKKILDSRRTGDSPVVTLIKGDLQEALVDTLDEIYHLEPDGANVFVLGRYNFLKPKDLSALQRKYTRLSIEYSTIHRSKRLERDYVILVGLRSGIYGFPC